MGGYSMEYLEGLAQITLSEEERRRAEKDLERMLGLMDILGKLDTAGVEPMSLVFPVQNVFREDVEAQSGEEGSCSNLSRGEGMFVVPRTVQ